MKKKRRQMYDKKKLYELVCLYEFVTQYNGKIDFENLY